MQVRKLVTGVAIIVATTLTALAAPASAVPVITVTPSTGLQDGQVVQVHASGLAASAPLRVVECAGGTNGSCRVLTQPTSDPTGTIDVAIVVHLVVIPPGGSNTPGARACQDDCSIVVADTSPLVAADIRFDPGATRVDHAITITPSSGLIAGQSVQVHVGAGFFDLGQSVNVFECSFPVTFDSIGQCGPGATVIASTVDASVDATVTVQSTFTVPGTSVSVDCRAQSCGLLAREGAFAFATYLSAPIAFAPAVSPTTTVAPATTVAPVVSATPRFTG